MASFDLNRLLAIGAAIISIGAAVFSGLDRDNNLQFTTKEDFGQFQLKNVEEMTSLKSVVSSGFVQLGNQVSNLQFVPVKEFLEYKDKTNESNFEIKKEIEFLKRDLNNLAKTNEANIAKAAALEARINLLSEQLAKAQKDNFSLNK